MKMNNSSQQVMEQDSKQIAPKERPDYADECFMRGDFKYQPISFNNEIAWDDFDDLCDEVGLTADMTNIFSGKELTRYARMTGQQCQPLSSDELYLRGYMSFRNQKHNVIWPKILGNEARYQVDQQLSDPNPKTVWMCFSCLWHECCGQLTFMTDPMKCTWDDAPTVEAYKHNIWKSILYQKIQANKKQASEDPKRQDKSEDPKEQDQDEIPTILDKDIDPQIKEPYHVIYIPIEYIEGDDCNLEDSDRDTESQQLRARLKFIKQSRKNYRAIKRLVKKSQNKKNQEESPNQS
jgi:hypothetical protein